MQKGHLIPSQANVSFSKSIEVINDYNLQKQKRNDVRIKKALTKAKFSFRSYVYVLYHVITWTHRSGDRLIKNVVFKKLWSPQFQKMRKKQSASELC